MMPLFAPVARLLAGHRLYAVGGAVRAWLIADSNTAMPYPDVDFATPSLPQEILASAQACQLAAQAPGLRWGCVQVAGCEITTFRTEYYAPHSRYPTVTFTPELSLDAQRRDFTCNAVYLAPDASVTDPFGGAADWRQQQVVWLGSPAQRLADDPLRWWRWLRFCAEAGPNSCAQPQWYNLANGQREPVALAALMHLTHTHVPALGLARLAKERAKFGAQPHARAVRDIVAAVLAQHPNLAQELLP
jgi:hypothetical protein